jgi:short-subunit dehydrogenase
VCTIAARRLARLEEVAKMIHTAYPAQVQPLPVACEVTDRASVAAAIEAAVQHMGGIDLLINNAGISVYGQTERMDAEDLARVMDVNFLGCVNGMQEILPIMRKQGGGHIVNIASLAALHGVPYLAAYGASKAALAAFSQSLRAEVSSAGITIQVIYPGYIQTPIFAKERSLGGAIRPQPPYEPVDSMAYRIANAIAKEKPEVFFGPRGKLMAFLRGAMPWVLRRTMRSLAIRLGKKQEGCHAQAQA